MILFYDCFSGISGDMNLAAMIDLGVPADHLAAELKKLALEGYRLEIEKDSRNGIAGTRVKVRMDEDQHHHHRKLSDIVGIIDQSDLNAGIRKNSIYMFRKLAEAEAKVHGKEVDEIHFHEVGAVDSIVDIVGAAICFDYLSPEKIYASPPELGSGLVKCEHGIFPVPAPATAEILRGIPVKKGAQPFEATTPTGAVILACNVDEFTERGSFRIVRTAYGIGHKTSDIPNVLRVFEIEAHDEGTLNGSHLMFECNIDDMTPERISYVMEKLFEAGADDVFITPIIMKKSRNASRLSILCRYELKETVSRLIISETSTFGFRYYSVEKKELERELKELETKYGKVRVKIAYHGDGLIRQKPEYEDCARLARANGVPLPEIYREVERLLNG